MEGSARSPLFPRLLLWGFLLITVGPVLVPILVAPIVFRLATGSAPIRLEHLDRITIGMSMGEVRSRFGTSYQTYDDGDGGETWYYAQDPFAVGRHGIRFNPAGAVEKIWSN